MFCLEFPWVKQKSKNSSVVLRKHVLNPFPSVLLYSGIVPCDTGSIERSTPSWRVKLLLFSHIPNIFAANMLSNTGNRPKTFYILFLSEIKIKILINSLYFLMKFLNVLSATFSVTPSVLSNEKWWDRTHTGQVLVIYGRS